MIVGFAAETGDADHTVLQLGRAKLERKGCDLLVVNDVSGGKVFGSDVNEAVILDRDGNALPVPSGSKVLLDSQHTSRQGARGSKRSPDGPKSPCVISQRAGS